MSRAAARLRPSYPTRPGDCPDTARRNLPLARQENDDVLQASLSYYPNDLVVVGWNAALVYDTPAGAETSVQILEYVNSQLLEFRHYDELLTRELAGVYTSLNITLACGGAGECARRLRGSTP